MTPATGWGNNAFSATWGTFVTQLQGLIAQDRALGGDVAVSFGGYNACVSGKELAQVITGAPALQAAYQSVVSTWRNVPAVQFGDGHGYPNQVGLHAYFECGFHVVLPNPAHQHKHYSHISVPLHH